MDDNVRTLLGRYPEPVAGLAECVREWIHLVVPGVAEEADASGNLIGFGIGPGYKGVVCTIMLSQGCEARIERRRFPARPCRSARGHGKEAQIRPGPECE